MTTTADSNKLKQLIEKRILLGRPLTPELTAILLVYFVQGILGLSRLSVSFFLKDDLGLSPAEMAALIGVSTLPWTIKPLFGFLSDGLPIFGYRRRPYLILSGLLGAVAWLALATLVYTAWLATTMLLLSSLSVAVSDVIIDSLVVERARQESQGETGTLQSLCWGASALGGLLTAYLSGLLLDKTSPHVVFALTATFPLIVSCVAWLITEEPVQEKLGFQTVWTHFKQLKLAVSQRTIWMPALFLFLWQSTPSADSAFFFFTTNDLGFEPEFLGRVKLITSLAALLGIAIFQRFLKAVPFRTIFAWSTVLASLGGMTTLLLVTHANRSLGIEDHWFSLGDNAILTAMGQIAFMPILVLAARLCPSGVEATLFALLMSIVNLAMLTSHELGALLTQWLHVTETDFENLWLLVTITNLTTLLPLPLLFLLPNTSASSNSELAALPGESNEDSDKTEPVLTTSSS